MSRTRLWTIFLITVAALIGALWIGRDDITRFIALTLEEPPAGIAPTSAAPSPMLTLVGPAPAPRIAVAPDGRIYAGAAASADGGRTWTALRDTAGRSITLLGASRAVDFAIAPDGRVLFGEVIFESPGIPAGQGEIAHAVEWSGSAWSTVVSAREDDQLFLYRPTRQTSQQVGNQIQATVEFEREPVPPRIPVQSVAYQPDGQWVIATSDGILFPMGQTTKTRGAPRSVLAASDGTVYVVVDNTPLSLYRASAGSRAFAPVGGTGQVLAVGETRGAVVLVTAQQSGRIVGERVEWRPWPAGSGMNRVSAHADSPVVVVWQRRGAIVSVDAGITFAPVVLPPDVDIASVAVDPRSPRAAWIVDRRSQLYSLRF